MTFDEQIKKLAEKHNEQSKYEHVKGDILKKYGLVDGMAFFAFIAGANAAREILQGEIDKLRGAFETIANKQTCEKLNPGCKKYKSYEDGWNGIAEYATEALSKIKGDE